MPNVDTYYFVLPSGEIKQYPYPVKPAVGEIVTFTSYVHALMVADVKHAIDDEALGLKYKIYIYLEIYNPPN